MADYINIKSINTILHERDLVKGGVEDNLFDFTVMFYHGVSLIKPNSIKKTTKEFVTFLLTQCIIKFISALGQINDDVIKDLDSCVEQNRKIIDFTNDEICNNFINIFNCETDQYGAFFKLSALYCLATVRYNVTNDDVIECLKTIR